MHLWCFITSYDYFKVYFRVFRMQAAIFTWIVCIPFIFHVAEGAYIGDICDPFAHRPCDNDPTLLCDFEEHICNCSPLYPFKVHYWCEEGKKYGEHCFDSKQCIYRHSACEVFWNGNRCVCAQGYRYHHQSGECQPGLDPKEITVLAGIAITLMIIVIISFIITTFFCAKCSAAKTKATNFLQRKASSAGVIKVSDASSRKSGSATQKPSHAGSSGGRTQAEAPGRLEVHTIV